MLATRRESGQPLAARMYAMTRLGGRSRSTSTRPRTKVWALVSDVTRIGEFSPETFEARWRRGSTGPEVGARFKGHVKRNGVGPTYWSACRVTSAYRTRSSSSSSASTTVTAQPLGLPARARRRRHVGHRVLRARPSLPHEGVLAGARAAARPDQRAGHAHHPGADEGGARGMSTTHREAMLEKLADLDAEHARAVAGGGEKYVDRHHARGKLLPRERIELLVDPGSAFLELSPLAGWGSDFSVGASLVTGIGVVEGVECLITANDPTVKGGASNPWTVKKGFRAAQIAEENGLPTISLVESGGADLPTQKEIFIPGGKVFRDLTRAWHVGSPTIALVFGNSTAGGAYVPGMSDYTVMVREQAKVFLGGPAAGEDGDRRGVRRRVAGRRRDARPHLGPGRLPRRGRARRDPDRPTDRGPPQLAQASIRPASTARPTSPGWAEPDADVDDAARPDPVGPQGAVRPARGDRADLRRRRAGQREAVRRVQAALRHLAGHRLGAPPRPPDRDPRQRPGRDLQRGGTEGDPVHPARQPGRHPAALPAQHHRLHGGCGVRAGRDHQARRPDDQRGQQQQGARTSA